MWEVTQLRRGGKRTALPSFPMTFEDLGPYKKPIGLAIGILIVGLLLRLLFSGGHTAACNDLPMDKINPCLERAKTCSGTPEEARACVDKIVREMR